MRMTREQVIERLTPIFHKVFKDDSIIVTDSLNANDVKKWDSLSNTLMLADVEKEFNIKLKFKDISKMQHVGDLIDLTTKHSEN